MLIPNLREIWQNKATKIVIDDYFFIFHNFLTKLSFLTIIQVLVWVSYIFYNNNVQRKYYALFILWNIRNKNTLKIFRNVL